MYICSNGIKTAVILSDNHAESPREAYDNLTKMVCWHSRYNLGDKHSYKEPRDFAEAMVDKYLKPQDVFKAMAAGELKDFRLIDDGNGGDYAVEARIGLIPSIEKWERMGWKVSRQFEVVEDPDASFDMEYDVLDNCWPDEMLRMCEKYGDVAILPLYLYDHSGISMSTGSFVGRAPHAEWDSGQVGYIYMDKETAMRELAMPGDEVRVAMEGSFSGNILVKSDQHIEFDKVMEENGFSPVKREHITNLGEHSELGYYADSGTLYKKDHKLYVMDEQKPDCSYVIRAIATYNPNLLPLTDEMWKAWALEVLEGDVVVYDNYLTGEVYGYQCYEGLEEVDSCWGFNPGRERIQDLMNDELRGWFGSEMEFKYESGDDFDIEDYMQENDFPELRGKIREDVEAFLHQVGSKYKEGFPYAASYEDICQNKNDVLSDVIETLYEEHALPDAARIHEAFQEHAGISREAQPKLTVADLETGRDYTAAELMEIMNNKARGQINVEDLIASAKSRVGEAPARENGKDFALD